MNSLLTEEKDNLKTKVSKSPQKQHQFIYFLIIQINVEGKHPHTSPSQRLHL